MFVPPATDPEVEAEPCRGLVEVEPLVEVPVNQAPREWVPAAVEVPALQVSQVLLQVLPLAAVVHKASFRSISNILPS